MLGLVAIAANLACCSSARFTPGDQQDMSQECGSMRQRLATDNPLTPAQAAEIAKAMEKGGCARRPSRPVIVDRATGRRSKFGPLAADRNGVSLGPSGRDG
jgi:hypothetical protein